MLLLRIGLLISLFHILFLSRLNLGLFLFLDFLFKLFGLNLRLTLLLGLLFDFFLFLRLLLHFRLLLGLLLLFLLLSVILLVFLLVLFLVTSFDCSCSSTLSSCLSSLSLLVPLLLFLGISILLLLEVLLLLLAGLLVLDLLLTLVQGSVDLLRGQLLSFVLVFAVAVGEFLELGNEETVHVVHVRVDSASKVEGRVESEVLVLGETWQANFFAHADLDQFDVACPKGIVNYPFVLFNGYRASRVTKEDQL